MRSVFGFGVGAVVVKLEEHGEHHHRGRYARAASWRILVKRSVVLIIDEHIAPVGKSGIEGVGGY
jgi:hypothetical protein